MIKASYSSRKQPVVPASRGARTTGLTLAAFAILCGLLLATLGVDPVPYTAPEATSKQHIDAAARWSLQTERALHDGNYGEAEESVVELRKRLDAAVAALES